jgi:hypothetical protein
MTGRCFTASALSLASCSKWHATGRPASGSNAGRSLRQSSRPRPIRQRASKRQPPGIASAGGSEPVIEASSVPRSSVSRGTAASSACV